MDGCGSPSWPHPRESRPPRCATTSGSDSSTLPARTSSGYRDYGEDAAARLLFITRARRMGLSCEQVTDLIPVWDGANCGAAQERVGRLIDREADGDRRADRGARGVRRAARHGSCGARGGAGAAGMPGRPHLLRPDVLGAGPLPSSSSLGARPARSAAENDRAFRPSSRTSPWRPKDDADDPRLAGQPAGLFGADPLTVGGGRDTDPAEHRAQVERDHHRRRGATMYRDPVCGRFSRNATNPSP